MCAASLGLAWACDSGSSGDGGTDANSEAIVDICSTFTSVGDKCAHSSGVVCFRDPTCEAGNGCSCKDTDAGPTWECFTPPECVNPCNSSPYADAQGCDAEAGPANDAGADAEDAAAE